MKRNLYNNIFLEEIKKRQRGVLPSTSTTFRPLSIDGTLERTSRLVAWRVNNLMIKANTTITSKDFKIGKWNWYIECQINLDHILLWLKARDTESLPVPIISLAVRVFCSRGSSSIQKNNQVHTDNVGLIFQKINTSTLAATAPVIFGLEFLDLKLKHGNDGKTYSIWNEEYSDQNTSNESANKMLAESIFTDITINARDGSIRAHRAILAAKSPVFKAMFSPNYKETSTVNADMSIESCKAMLNFIYGERNNNKLRAFNLELMTAADHYDIVDLQNACEACLCDDVGEENIIERLLYAHTHDLQELKRICLFYLVKMGMIYELREDCNFLLRKADAKLAVEVLNACLDAWRAS